MTLFGYEWTSWIHGHRHVLYFSEDAPLLSSMDERYETPEQLWAELADHSAVTVPHHPAGGPIAIDWGVPPDPLLDPVCEVISAHGCREALHCPRLLHRPRRAPAVGVVARGVPEAFAEVGPHRLQDARVHRGGGH